MKNKSLMYAALGLVAAGAIFAADPPKAESRVTVTFVQPEKFTDASGEDFNDDRDREHVLASLKSHVEKMAQRYLAAGQSLEVRFVDIDLAGAFESWRGPEYDRIRILKEIYPPRMTLEFRLLGADGKVLAEGKRKLSTLGYLMSHAFPSSDGLRYDKEMLGAWMRQEFRRNS